MQGNKLAGQPIICQLISFIPKEIVSESVKKYESDKYYKTPPPSQSLAQRNLDLLCLKFSTLATQIRLES
jgi:hypothetical protein